MPLLGVAAMLRLFLLYLMLEVLVLGLGVPRGFQLLSAIEICNQIAGFYRGSIRDQTGERQVTALAADPRRLNRKGPYRLHNSGGPHAPAQLSILNRNDFRLVCFSGGLNHGGPLRTPHPEQDDAEQGRASPRRDDIERVHPIAN